jgi:RimJ/RimL family protein N-acetyltransferase
MLKLLPGDTGPLLARIHRLNAPSIAVFEKVGFAVAHAEGNWLVFRR